MPDGREWCTPNKWFHADGLAFGSAVLKQGVEAVENPLSKAAIHQRRLLAPCRSS